MRFFLDFVSGRFISNASTTTIVIAVVCLNCFFRLPTVIRGVYQLPIFSGSVEDQMRRTTFARNLRVYEHEMRELSTLKEDLYAYRNWLDSLLPELDAYQNWVDQVAYQSWLDGVSSEPILRRPDAKSLTIPQPQLPIQNWGFVVTKNNFQKFRLQAILYRSYQREITAILRPFLFAADIQNVDTNRLRLTDSTPFRRMLACLANRHRDYKEARRVSELVGEGRQLRQWIVNVRGTIMEFNELSQILEALNEVPSIPDETLMLLFSRVRDRTLPTELSADGTSLWGVNRQKLSGIYATVRATDAQAQLNIARNNR